MTATKLILDMTSDAPDTTLAVATSFARHLAPGDVVLLEGPLGAGKTLFVRGLAIGLGIEAGAVSSPTFVMMQRYEGPGVDLVHLDLYRLDGPDELESIGWEAPRADGPDITAIEWPERLGDDVPPHAVTVTLQHVDERRRRIRITGPAGRGGRALVVETAAAQCRRCENPVAEAFAPFCSSRCRLLDLGAWLSGSYQISRPLDEPDA